MHPSELGDRLVVGLQTSQQPHHFHVALALGLQPPRRPHLPQIPVQVQLQQSTRIVARSSRLRRLGTHKSQRRHIQPPNERLHVSTHVVHWNQFVQGRGKHRPLLPRLTPDIRHKKMPPLPRGHLLIPYQGRLVFRNRLKMAASEQEDSRALAPVPSDLDVFHAFVSASRKSTSTTSNS